MGTKGGGIILIGITLIIVVNARPITDQFARFKLPSMWGDVMEALPASKIEPEIVYPEDTVFGECDIVPVMSSRRLRDVQGRIQFRQKFDTGRGGAMAMSMRLQGLPRSSDFYYRLEIHKYGEVTQGCQDVGPIQRTTKYTGKLVDFLVDPDGNVGLDLPDMAATLVGHNSVLGRSVVINGQVGRDPVGCCVVVHSRTPAPFPPYQVDPPALVHVEPYHVPGVKQSTHSVTSISSRPSSVNDTYNINIAKSSGSSATDLLLNIDPNQPKLVTTASTQFEKSNALLTNNMATILESKGGELNVKGSIAEQPINPGSEIIFAVSDIIKDNTSIAKLNQISGMNTADPIIFHEGVQDSIEDTVQGIVDSDSITETVGEVLDGINDNILDNSDILDVGDTLLDKVDDMADTVQKLIEPVQDIISDASTEILDDTVEKVDDMISDPVRIDDSSEVMSDIKDVLPDSIQDSETLDDISDISQVDSVSGEVIDGVKDMAQDVTGQVQEIADDASIEVQDELLMFDHDDIDTSNEVDDVKDKKQDLTELVHDVITDSSDEIIDNLSDMVGEADFEDENKSSKFVDDLKDQIHVFSDAVQDTVIDSSEEMVDNLSDKVGDVDIDDEDDDEKPKFVANKSDEIQEVFDQSREVIDTGVDYAMDQLDDIVDDVKDSFEDDNLTIDRLSVKDTLEEVFDPVDEITDSSKEILEDSVDKTYGIVDSGDALSDVLGDVKDNIQYESGEIRDIIGDTQVDEIQEVFDQSREVIDTRVDNAMDQLDDIADEAKESVEDDNLIIDGLSEKNTLKEAFDPDDEISDSSREILENTDDKINGFVDSGDSLSDILDDVKDNIQYESGGIRDIQGDTQVDTVNDIFENVKEEFEGEVLVRDESPDFVDVSDGLADKVEAVREKLDVEILANDNDESAKVLTDTTDNILEPIRDIMSNSVGFLDSSASVQEDFSEIPSDILGDVSDKMNDIKDHAEFDSIVTYDTVESVEDDGNVQDTKQEFAENILDTADDSSENILDDIADENRDVTGASGMVTGNLEDSIDTAIDVDDEIPEKMQELSSEILDTLPDMAVNIAGEDIIDDVGDHIKNVIKNTVDILDDANEVDNSLFDLGDSVKSDSGEEGIISDDKLENKIEVTIDIVDDISEKTKELPGESLDSQLDVLANKAGKTLHTESQFVDDMSDNFDSAIEKTMNVLNDINDDGHGTVEIPAQSDTTSTDVIKDAYSISAAGNAFEPPPVAQTDTVAIISPDGAETGSFAANEQNTETNHSTGNEDDQ